MDFESKKFFEEACIEYLMSLSLNDLRAYGRSLGLPTPTQLKKIELIKEILQVVGGGKEYTRTKRGAPIKNDYFPKEIPLTLEKIQERCFGEEVKGKDEKQAQKEEKNAVILQFSVVLAKLNDIQKKLLNDFLNSL